MKKAVLLILLFISACGELSDEQSILDKSDCDAPCWNGIVAGQTTESEVLKILVSLPDIDPDSVKINDGGWDVFDQQIAFHFRQPWSLDQRPRLRGFVDLKDSRVATLMVCGDISTSMGALVKNAGEPEYILSGDDISGNRTVILIDPNNGISYWYTAELNGVEITSDTHLDCVHFFDQSLYEEMLDAKLFSGGSYNAEETRMIWYRWDGYGNLDEKYPPRQP